MKRVEDLWITHIRAFGNCRTLLTIYKKEEENNVKTKHHQNKNKKME
jgi:hypothetical protein